MSGGALMTSILGGEASTYGPAIASGLGMSEAEQLPDRFLAGTHNALHTKTRSRERLKAEKIKKLTRRLGEVLPDRVIHSNGQPTDE